jgi:hypothetical protein
MFPLNTIIAWSINIIMNKKYDNNNIIIASRAYFLQTHLLGFVRLCHRIMNNLSRTQYLRRFPSVDPKWAFHTPFAEPSCVIVLFATFMGHTWEQGIGSFHITTHLYAYVSARDRPRTLPKGMPN